MSATIRHATEADLPAIAALYRTTATAGGLARQPDEITPDYIQHNWQCSQARGLSMVALTTQGALCGEIHAWRPEPRQFNHVLSDLTIAIHPNYQGQGIGRTLFSHFLKEVESNMPGIRRVELLARESNTHAIALYQSLGFTLEGKLRGRVATDNGPFEDDCQFAWLRTAR